MKKGRAHGGPAKLQNQNTCTQFSCLPSPTPASRGTYPQLQVDGVVMVTGVKCEGYLHGSRSNSTVMSCRTQVLLFTGGSHRVGLRSCSQPVHQQLPVPHTAEAAHACVPFNLGPTHSLHGQRWKDVLGKLLISIHVDTKLTDLIR